MAYESPIGVLVRPKTEFVRIEQKDVQLTVGADESPQEDPPVGDCNPKGVIQETLNRREWGKHRMMDVVINVPPSGTRRRSPKMTKKCSVRNHVATNFISRNDELGATWRGLAVQFGVDAPLSPHDYINKHARGALPHTQPDVSGTSGG